MKKYIPSEIEVRWQKRWQESGQWRVDLSAPKRKFYLLVEFTYPSGDLHMGHWFAFTVPDILSRMKRMQGYTVFAPNGFDAFGLPAENAAIKRKIHPSDWTHENIARMKQQFATMGAIYDWEHEVITCESEYYRWNQWIFLKMYEKGLAYRAKAMANWCPKDQCVLANENVENGRCWRCGSEVVQKEVEQWFLRITDYANKLIWDDKNAGTQWPKSLKEGQNNWIGKNEGVEIDFPIVGSGEKITAFTRFPETIFGVTYMVLAPEHPMVSGLTTDGQKSKVEEYIKAVQKKSELDRTSLDREKTGVFTGSYVANPVNGEKVPIWIGDYVISTYGTGAVMGVPGSDHRDFMFAKKYDLPVVKVIARSNNDQSPIASDKTDAVLRFLSSHDSIMGLKDVLEEGYIVNSGQFNGLTTPDPAKLKITNFLEEEGWGRRKTNYHLHDWSISRQRYWGTPIPIIYCDKCGTVPVREKDLPVELPYKLSLRSSSNDSLGTAGLDVDFAPKGKPPLATAEEWVKVKCPICEGEARREVETMDTFFDSSWYFLRYLDPKNKKEIANKKILAEWMPVDIYFGGAEHTLGHTLYSRFFVKFLRDIGVLGFDEYAKKRVHHGVILGPDGARMSKSHGNVVNPDSEVKQYGADAVRLYLAFLGPYDLVAPWNPGGIRGVYNFLQRVWRLFESVDEKANLSEEDRYEMNRAIKKVGEDIEAVKFNTGVSTLMQWLNHLSRKAGDGKVSDMEYKTFLTILAPYAPHITEELWEMLSAKGSIHEQKWPKYDEKSAAAAQVTLVVQVNGKVRDKLPIEAGTGQKEAEKLALASERVQKFLEKKKPRKVIFVPDRLINLVV